MNGGSGCTGVYMALARNWISFSLPLSACASVSYFPLFYQLCLLRTLVIDVARMGNGAI